MAHHPGTADAAASHVLRLTEACEPLPWPFMRTRVQALYSDRSAVNIAPVDCYDPETGALVCLAGVNLAEVLREEIATADLIDTASGRRRSAAAKARVPDSQLPALLQAKEVSLRVWQIIWSLVAFSMQGPGGKPLQDGLSQSALAQVRPP